jgi:two-component system LytT family response regulator
MSKIRTLVVDDEPIARARMVSLLREESDIELVGECSNGHQAASAIQSTNPDLLFLDIQMPEGDGLSLARTIQSNGAPAVVFVTAYDEYALRAFEVHALDYLLKPFGRDRFQQTLQHARAILERRRAGDLGRRLLALVNDIKTEPGPTRLDRLVVKSGGRVFFLRTDQIDWIEAAGNYVKLHVGTETHLLRETMNASTSTSISWVVMPARTSARRRSFTSARILPACRMRSSSRADLRRIIASPCRPRSCGWPR